MKNIKHIPILFALGLAVSGQAALTAWWDFEETNLAANGDPIYDNVASTPATLWNTLWSGLNIPGKFGNASTGGIYFDGVTDNMAVVNANAAATQPTGDFSIALWVRPDGAQQNFARFIDTASNKAGAPNDGYRLNTTATAGQVQFATSGGLDLRSNDTYTTNQWNLLVVRYEVGGTVSLNVLTEGDSVDAAFVSANATTASAGTAIAYSGGNTKMGAALAGSTDFEFKGNMDDLAFYDGLLTDEEIVAIFKRGLADDNFLYPATAVSSGGQYSAGFSPSNLMNNGFTSYTGTIDTTADYIPDGNNYASATGTVDGFSITFNFEEAAELSGMYVWNYVYRNGTAGAASPTSGVNGYTLTFYDGTNGTGSVIGSPFSGNLSPAVWDGTNSAQRVDFGPYYSGVRSVVMSVESNHGSTDFTGLNELAFNGTGGISIPHIESFSSSLGQRPNPTVLSWTVGGQVTSLAIDQGIGDVTGLTTNGSGSVAIYPLGAKTYTLTLNGTLSSEVTAIGLPEKQKVHIYLLIGQSNMQGEGRWANGSDGPHPRVLKFGSRSGMETVFAEGTDPLVALTGGGTKIGMGVKFGKTMLAAQSDTNVVICLINHAMGNSAIQWWAPGVMDNKQVNPQTGLNYYLYDEAVQRVHDAETYGVLKGVLWHQGEYNSGTQTNPNSEPELYAGRLQTLVDNLRTDFQNPSLPFICGKLVPASWIDGGGNTVIYSRGPYCDVVEAALADLPNQRSNTFCVDNDGLRGNSSDLVHFDAYSQRLLGQRYASAMTNFYSDPYRLYLGGYLTPAQMSDPVLTDPLEDNDGDGRNNYMEYALRFNPMQADYTAPMTLSVLSLPPKVSFHKRTDTEAPVYRVGFSTNLVDWVTNTVVDVEGSPLDHGDGSATVTVQPVEDTANGFFRLQVGPE